MFYVKFSQNQIFLIWWHKMAVICTGIWAFFFYYFIWYVHMCMSVSCLSYLITIETVDQLSWHWWYTSCGWRLLHLHTFRFIFWGKCNLVPFRKGSECSMMGFPKIAYMQCLYGKQNNVIALQNLHVLLHVRAITRCSKAYEIWCDYNKIYKFCVKHLLGIKFTNSS
jgi:hypothetical protein